MMANQKSKMTVAEKLLSESTLKTEIVEIGDQKVEVRQPTIGTWREIRKRNTGADGQPDWDTIELEAVVAFCFDPETGQPCFNGTHLESFKTLPLDSQINKLIAAVLRLVFPKQEEVKNA